MNYLIIKALISGVLITAISELAKRNNLVAAVVHSLPLVSILAFIWLYQETKDSTLIGQHAYATFWMVLPTLPMFVAMPWLIRHLGGFWPALLGGIVMTAILYAVTLFTLGRLGIKL